MRAGSSRFPRRLLTAILLFLVAGVLPSTAGADWEDGVFVSTSQAVLGNDMVRIFRPTPDGLQVVWRRVNGTTRARVAQSMSAQGGIAPGWPPQGVALGGIFSDPFPAAADGAGGVFDAYPLSGNVYFDHAAGDGSLAFDLPAATTAATESRAGIASDGAGGAYVGWVAAGTSVYLMRFLSDGTPAPGWPVGGLVMPEPVSSGVSDPPAIDGDGAGGAYVVWKADKVRALRVNADGTIAAGWPAGGLVLGLGLGGMSTIRPIEIFPSGDGRIVVWFEVTYGYDMVVQRFQSNGALDPAWYPDGFYITYFDNGAGPYCTVSDGMGGVTVVWEQSDLPRAFRVLSNGQPAPGFAGDGNSLLDAGAQYVPSQSLVAAKGPDGGLVFAWNDTRPSRPGVRVRWFDASGAPDPDEPDTGRVAGPTNASVRGAIDDGEGGVYVAWNENGYLKMNHLTSSAAVGVGPGLPAPGGPMLRAVAPNPASRELHVRVSLPDAAPSRLELLDLAGRRLRARELSGAGEQTVRFQDLEHVPPGVYLLRLSQGRESRFARFAITR